MRLIRRNDSMSHMTVSMTALKMRCFHTVMTSIPNHEVAMFVRVPHVCCVCVSVGHPLQLVGGNFAKTDWD